jgi:FtsP/CotA-like multicopper oxidase with cupredoxin domain
VLALVFVLLLGCAGTGPEKNDTESKKPPAAEASEMKFVQLANGTTYSLEAKEVVKDIGGQKISMFAYNDQIPGPVLRVKQGSTIWINFTNSIPHDTTVHWHGIRLENKYDGVPNVTQDAVPPGGSFLYKVDFPDEGMYWYHPHVREELQQELGLYGVIIVEPSDTGYFDDADLEEVVVLDDILMKGSSVYPFQEEVTDFALMGRFGNLILVNGKTDYQLKAKEGETVRLYLLNAANVRPFNFSIEGHEMKVVAGDGSKFEKSYMADSVVITPSERFIVEVVFDKAGEYELRNENPLNSYVIGKVIVEDSDAAPAPLSESTNQDMVAELESYRQYYDKEPDFEYDLTIDIEGGMMGGGMMGMMEHTEGGIEWEDTMPMMNRNSNSDRVKWIIKDKKSGKTNMDAVREIPKGKLVKIKLDNLEKSEHPMQHTIHIHGAQFLVLKTDGIKNDNLVWKDSVNIPIGSTTELLVEFPKEGEWMMHCHIAEHLSSGMMTSFEVN